MSEQRILDYGILTNVAGADVSVPVPNNKEFATVYVWGTFDGATVKLQDRPAEADPAGNPIDEWFDTDDVTGTSKFRKNIRVAAASQLRMFSSGGGGSQSVNYMIVTS